MCILWILDFYGNEAHMWWLIYIGKICMRKRPWKHSRFRLPYLPWQLGSFLSRSRHPRWPRQVKKAILRHNITGVFAYKSLICKWAMIGSIGVAFHKVAQSKLSKCKYCCNVRFCQFKYCLNIETCFHKPSWVPGRTQGRRWHSRRTASTLPKENFVKNLGRIHIIFFVAYE